MHKTFENDWLRHFRFFFGDFICLQLSFLIPLISRRVSSERYDAYIALQVILTFFFIFVILFNESYKSVYSRGFLIEAKKTIFQVTLVFLLAIAMAFFLKSSTVFSRVVLVLMYFFTLSLTYSLRVIIKKISKESTATNNNTREVIVFTQSDKIEALYQAIGEGDFVKYKVKAINFMDDNVNNIKLKGDCIVIPTVKDALEYIKNSVIDDVVIYAPDYAGMFNEIEDKCVSMGVIVHYVTDKKRGYARETVEIYGDYRVITCGMNIVSARQLILKRLMDFCGSLVGLLVTGICFIFVAPIIYISSPGPIFFTQTRIGKNGRRFKIYKFRSMYMDAEERKAELMAQNKMEGLMFKIDDDPRIIKGIGNFIRKSSIDELPQMWNVLKGDMSLVGTRPPTVDEFEKYDFHHKSRLAMRPGITGMWQVSGRSDITDFEEVVALDNKYISQWNISLDIKILFETIVTVLKKRGSV